MSTTRRRGAVVVMGALGAAVSSAVAPALAQEPGTASAATAPTAAAAPPAGSVATAPPAGTVAPAAAKSTPTITVGRARRAITLGRRALVVGHLMPARAGRLVQLQVRDGDGWTTVAQDHTSAGGAYRLRYTPGTPRSTVARVHFGGDGRAERRVKALGRVDVFRRAFASWYGPGLYGQHLACGGTLTAGTLGVANKTLPCGTKITLRYHGRSVRVPVVDRGPYVGGRDFDLTAATKQRLGFGSTGTVLSTR